MGNHILRTMTRNQFLNGPDAAAAGINPKMSPRTAGGLFEDFEPVLVLGMDMSHWNQRANSVSYMDTYKNASLCIFVIDGSVSFWLWLTLLDTALCGLCPPNTRVRKTTEATLGTSFWIVDIQGTSRRSVRHVPRTFLSYE